MAKRPLAMCNQLTGCGKLTKCFILNRSESANPRVTLVSIASKSNRPMIPFANAQAFIEAADRIHFANSSEASSIR
jgi:hypothetical protein